MAGPAPTDFQSTRTPDAGPVHCSVWLFPLAASPPFRIGDEDQCEQRWEPTNSKCADTDTEPNAWGDPSDLKQKLSEDRHQDAAEKQKLRFWST